MSMADNIDYEELSEKTISEIKDTVDEHGDIDYERLLEAEKDNKDRKTLKEWLQKRIDQEESEGEDDTDEGEEFGCPKCDQSFDSKEALHEHAEEAHSEEEEEEEKEQERHNCPKCGRTFASEEALERHKDDQHAVETGSTAVTSTSIWKQPSTMFLIGLAIGLAIAAAVSFNAPGIGGGTAMTPQQAGEKTVNYIDQQLDPTNQANFSVTGVRSDAFSDLYVVNIQVDSAQGSQEVQAYVTKSSGIMFLPLQVQPIDLQKGQAISGLGNSTQ
ncbi:MAG: C2HC-type zinc finger protein [Candidatus Nanohaloarchaea archaeon]|nr:C2HC-type zinc finger protein [Candidatus Nanohaloarchaea archaeon]